MTAPLTPTESCVIDSPVGRLQADFVGDVLHRLNWTDAPLDLPHSPAAHRLADQLAAYFAGTLQRIDIETESGGTPFQRAVWDFMCTIRYGETRTYGQCAAAIGSVARAVGTACGENPIPILIPCHRILAADGLGGYSGRGGLKTKTALLALEGVQLPAQQLALPLV